jgi:hypothetical protein
MDKPGKSMKPKEQSSLATKAGPVRVRRQRRCGVCGRWPSQCECDDAPPVPRCYHGSIEAAMEASDRELYR